MNRITNRLKAGLLVGAAVMTVGIGTVAPATPVQAATVRGCAQSWSTSPGTCIEVITGSKNYSNRTQYVSSITVRAPRSATTASKLEAWAGNGSTGVAWYNTTKGLVVTFRVDKWIKSGSGVCGAFTWPGSTSRSIACITIRV